MPVVSHEAGAADMHAEPLDAIGQDLLERREITLLAKDPPPTVGAIQHAIDITTQRNSLRPRHSA